MLASIRVWLAYLWALAGDLNGARASMAAAQTELLELGMEVEREVIAANVAGSIEAHAHEWDLAERIFSRALAYTKQRGWHYYRAWGTAYFVSRLAETTLARGDHGSPPRWPARRAGSES